MVPRGFDGDWVELRLLFVELLVNQLAGMAAPDLQNVTILITYPKLLLIQKCTKACTVTLMQFSCNILRLYLPFSSHHLTPPSNSIFHTVRARSCSYLSDQACGSSEVPFAWPSPQAESSPTQINTHTLKGE